MLLPSDLINSNATIDTRQTNKSMNIINSTFGCEYTDEFDYLHCDPFRSEFEGNTTTYTSTKIMNITREPFYVDGKMVKQ
ncbi:MAG: hypothetical protein L0H53_04810 [Candidatus Nitrosocosmicus sp.]|nr:hypothetical protein [Candidatus Nitrosocosmicus sp.]